MSDLIDRQAAIDFIDAGHLVNPNEPRWSDNEVVNFLKSRPSAQPERKTEWISCDDKVPIVSGEFLVTLTDADGEWVSTAEWNTTFGGRWQDIFPGDGYRDISNVIAWMPLPEPYQAERREE